MYTLEASCEQARYQEMFSLQENSKFLLQYSLENKTKPLDDVFNMNRWRHVTKLVILTNNLDLCPCLNIQKAFYSNKYVCGCVCVCI